MPKGKRFDPFYRKILLKSYRIKMSGMDGSCEKICRIKMSKRLRFSINREKTSALKSPDLMNTEKDSIV